MIFSQPSISAMNKPFCMRFISLLRPFSIGIAAVLLLVAPTQAQPAAFQEAKDAYEFAEYGTAVQLFSDVAQDASVSDQYRREALRYLGRAYIARDMRSQAREVMSKLLKMEPPLVELDPNREPPDLMKIYYDVRKQVKGDYAVANESPGLQTLTIMDFRNSSIYERERFAPLSQGFPSMMINYLNGATDLKVIERQRIDWLLNELKLQKKANVVDQSTAVKMGKLLGATAVLFGNYSVVDDDRMRLSGRLVKVETSEILLSEKVMGEPDEFFSLVEELSRNLTRAINVQMEETELDSSEETQSLDAMIAYSDGLGDLDDGNYQAAREHFENALEHDPNYTMAERRLESLRPQLAAASTDSTGSGGGLEDERNR